MRAPRPPKNAPPRWALRVVSALLLCLIGWGRPSPTAAWQGATSRPPAFAPEGEVGVAPARPAGPSLERGAEPRRPDLRELDDRGAVGPWLPAPRAPALAGPGGGAAIAARPVAPLAGRASRVRPIARAPPAVLPTA